MRSLSILFVLLSSSLLNARGLEGTWSGFFQVSATKGGIELTLKHENTGWSAKAKLEPLGHSVSLPVENLRIQGTSVSFDTEALEKKHLHFDGGIVAGRLKGTVHLLGKSSAESGTWSAIIPALKTAAGQLPAPTGPFTPGRMSFDWTDPTRDEIETPDPNDKRELVVHVWYPSGKAAQCQPAPYLTDLPDMQPLLPKEVATSVPNVHTRNCAGAPINTGSSRWPVLIFSPGDEFKTLAYSSLEEDLASNGYVVVAIEYPYNAPVVRFPDGRTIRPLPEDRRSHQPEPATKEEARKRQFDESVRGLDYWAHDIAFVVAQLNHLDTSPTWPFKGRLDLSKIGAFGHSRGGLSSFRACQILPALRACANLDGQYRARPYPISSPTEAPKQPFLWIRSPQPIFTDEELPQVGLTRNQFLQEIELGAATMRDIAGGSFDLQLNQVDLDHLDFTDFRILETGLSEETLAARQRTLEITRAYLRAFFDNALQGKDSPLLHGPLDDFPEVDLTRYEASGR